MIANVRKSHPFPFSNKRKRVESARGKSPTTMDDSSTSAEGPVPQGPECPAPKRKCLDSGRGMFKNTWKLPEGIGSSSKGAKYAFCKYCSSHICIAHGGLNDVTRHVSGKTHKQRLHDIHSTPTLTTFASSTQNQSHKVMLAEVMFTDLVKAIFPDSAIARDFACKRTKSRSIICEALDPYYKKLRKADLIDSPYSLLCDESNDRGDSVKLLTVLVRAYESSNGVTRTRHLETVAIADLSSSGIFDSIEEVLRKYGLEFSNMISFASDTCNVMKGARKGVIARLRQKQAKIIDIHCMCHIKIWL